MRFTFQKLNTYNPLTYVFKKISTLFTWLFTKPINYQQKCEEALAYYRKKYSDYTSMAYKKDENTKNLQIKLNEEMTEKLRPLLREVSKVPNKWYTEFVGNANRLQDNIMEEIRLIESLERKRLEIYNTFIAVKSKLEFLDQFTISKSNTLNKQFEDLYENCAEQFFGITEDRSIHSATFDDEKLMKFKGDLIALFNKRRNFYPEETTFSDTGNLTDLYKETEEALLEENKIQKQTLEDAVQKLRLVEEELRIEKENNITLAQELAAAKNNTENVKKIQDLEKNLDLAQITYNRLAQESTTLKAQISELKTKLTENETFMDVTEKTAKVIGELNLLQKIDINLIGSETYFKIVGNINESYKALQEFSASKPNIPTQLQTVQKIIADDLDKAINVRFDKNVQPQFSSVTATPTETVTTPATELEKEALKIAHLFDLYDNIKDFKEISENKDLIKTLLQKNTKIMASIPDKLSGKEEKMLSELQERANALDETLSMLSKKDKEMSAEVTPSTELTAEESRKKEFNALLDENRTLKQEVSKYKDLTLKIEKEHAEVTAQKTALVQKLQAAPAISSEEKHTVEAAAQPVPEPSETLTREESAFVEEMQSIYEHLSTRYQGSTLSRKQVQALLSEVVLDYEDSDQRLLPQYGGLNFIHDVHKKGLVKSTPPEPYVFDKTQLIYNNKLLGYPGFRDTAMKEVIINLEVTRESLKNYFDIRDTGATVSNPTYFYNLKKDFEKYLGEYKEYLGNFRARDQVELAEKVLLLQKRFQGMPAVILRWHSRNLTTLYNLANKIELETHHYVPPTKSEAQIEKTKKKIEQLAAERDAANAQLRKRLEVVKGRRNTLLAENYVPELVKSMEKSIKNLEGEMDYKIANVERTLNGLKNQATLATPEDIAAKIKNLEKEIETLSEKKNSIAYKEDLSARILAEKNKIADIQEAHKNKLFLPPLLEENKKRMETIEAEMAANDLKFTTQRAELSSDSFTDPFDKTTLLEQFKKELEKVKTTQEKEVLEKKIKELTPEAEKQREQVDEKFLREWKKLKTPEEKKTYLDKNPSFFLTMDRNADTADAVIALNKKVPLNAASKEKLLANINKLSVITIREILKVTFEEIESALATAQRETAEKNLLAATLKEKEDRIKNLNAEMLSLKNNTQLSIQDKETKLKENIFQLQTYQRELTRYKNETESEQLDYEKAVELRDKVGVTDPAYLLALDKLEKRRKQQEQDAAYFEKQAKIVKYYDYRDEFFGESTAEKLHSNMTNLILSEKNLTESQITIVRDYSNKVKSYIRNLNSLVGHEADLESLEKELQDKNEQFAVTALISNEALTDLTKSVHRLRAAIKNKNEDIEKINLDIATAKTLVLQDPCHQGELFDKNYKEHLDFLDQQLKLCDTIYKDERKKLSMFGYRLQYDKNNKIAKKEISDYIRDRELDEIKAGLKRSTDHYNALIRRLEHVKMVSKLKGNTSVFVDTPEKASSAPTTTVNSPDTSPLASPQISPRIGKARMERSPSLSDILNPKPPFNITSAAGIAQKAFDATLKTYGVNPGGPADQFLKSATEATGFGGTNNNNNTQKEIPKPDTPKTPGAPEKPFTGTVKPATGSSLGEFVD